MPGYNPKIHHRRSMRMRGYDYSLEGAYFITIGTYKHQKLFGEIVDGIVQLSSSGQIANDQWLNLQRRFPHADFSIYVIMPNHVHGIIYVMGAGEGLDNASPGIPTQRPYNGEDIVPEGYEDVIPRSLGVITRAYKTAVSFRINAFRGVTKPPIWQRNYYDHIIRNEKEFQQIKDYIEANPATWTDDRFYTPEKSL